MVFSHFLEAPGQNTILIEDFGRTCCTSKLCQWFQPPGRSLSPTAAQVGQDLCERAVSRRGADTWLPGLQDVVRRGWQWQWQCGRSLPHSALSFLTAALETPRGCESQLRPAGL